MEPLRRFCAIGASRLLYPEMTGRANLCAASTAFSRKEEAFGQKGLAQPRNGSYFCP